MLHQEVFRGIGSDHGLRHGDQLDLVALENRSGGGRFQGVAEQAIEFMDNDKLKRTLLADGVREQFL